MPISKRTEHVLFKSVLRIGCFATLVFLLACSPKLNWRNVQAPDQHYTALFPGKPEKMERQLPYQNQELKQSLEAIKIDDDIYSISTIKLPANTAGEASKIVFQLQSNLLDRANASGGIANVEEITYQTVDHQKFASKDYFITFKANEKIQQMMRVRWISRFAGNGDVWIYQISVLHTNPNSDDTKILLSKEEYETFFNEFHPD